MSKSPTLDVVACDPLISPDIATFTPSSSRPPAIRVPEEEPLMGTTPARRRKPFYRARPLWLVPFAVVAALVRGMTLAPRVEVYTQLACHALHKNFTQSHTSQSSSVISQLHGEGFSLALHALEPHLHAVDYVSTIVVPSDTDDDNDDPMTVPSVHCMSDSDVQAGAARLQTMMTIIMGSLSALTTGWWGHFGERHGRTRVLTLATLGAFLTDLTFILVSTPSSPLATHGHKLLIIAPIIEGLLGGWSALGAGITAYVSDCTSSGSRAHIFSRFTGVFYLGFSIGPSIGGWLIRHSSSITFFDLLGAIHPDPTRQSVTPVFWVAIMASFVNLLLVLFVIPESLSKDKQAAAQFEYSGKGKGKARAIPQAGDDAAQAVTGLSTVKESDIRIGFVKRLFEPLAVFLPTKINGRRDWSLTFVALSLSGYFLSAGIYQIKYLYAVHVYGWSAEVLSYYISFMGGARAVHLLFILPFIIATFKPQPGAKKCKSTAKSASQASNIGHLTGNNIRYTNIPTPPTKQIPKPSASKPGKPKITKAHLAREMRFDMGLCRFSLLLDIISNTFVLVAPAPTYKVHTISTGSSSVLSTSPAERHSQALFVMASSLTSFGSGLVPAVHSLALCILQARALNAEETQGNGVNGDQDSSGEAPAAGKLFGALAVLQAVGQMILGPLIFGLVYSGTVATFPKAIFSTATGVLVLSIVSIFLVQPPSMGLASKGKKRLVREDSEAERGRSRVTKDLRVSPSLSETSSYPSYGSLASRAGEDIAAREMN